MLQETANVDMRATLAMIDEHCEGDLVDNLLNLPHNVRLYDQQSSETVIPVHQW